MVFLRLQLLVSVMLSLSALSLRAGDSQRPPINPALTYWQAFSLLEELSGAESKVISDFISSPPLFDEDESRALLIRREKALSRFRKATESTATCDWGLTYEEGPYLALPHVSKIQTLSRLALLKAELLFTEQKTKEAMHWLFCAHRAARHCGSGDLILPVLAQFQMEQAAIRTSAPHVPDLDTTSRMEYLSEWNSLPPLHTVKDAINGELHFIGWLEKFWLQEPDIKINSNLTDLLSQHEDVAGITDEEREEAEKLAAQFTSENIRNWIQEMRNFYIKIQSCLDNPWLESNPELLELQSEYRSRDNPLMRLTTPMPMHKINDLSLRTATFQTMLKAVLDHGALLDERRIRAYADSFIGTPLTLGHPMNEPLKIMVSAELQNKIGGKIELPLHLPKHK